MQGSPYNQQPGSIPPSHEPSPGMQPPASNNKLAAGICGILLGCLGIHKFVMGYTQEGIIMLAISLVGGFFSCGIATGLVGIIGLIEGIIYLTKSDQQFMQEYVYNKKPWF